MSGDAGATCAAACPFAPLADVVGGRPLALDRDGQERKGRERGDRDGNGGRERAPVEPEFHHLPPVGRCGDSLEAVVTRPERVFASAGHKVSPGPE